MLRFPPPVSVWGARITGPDGHTRGVYFECAACGRNAVFVPDGKCEGCGHDTFKIRGEVQGASKVSA